METDIYRFQIGRFSCASISDGTFTYSPPILPPPAQFLFINAPSSTLAELMQAYQVDPAQWVSPYICLYIDTGEHKILVDSGAGKLGPDTGKLLANLSKVGVNPRDIDTVILTHSHPDHIGGLIDSNGSLNFVNARYFMRQMEWDFWSSEQAELAIDIHSRDILLGYARRILPSIQSRLNLISSEAEILPGIRALSTPGHTPGHMGLELISEGEQLLVSGDTVLHPIHIEQPDWFAAVDLNPEQVGSTRRRIFSMAVSNKSLVMSFHFQFPGLGHIIQDKGTWKWQPALVASSITR